MLTAAAFGALVAMQGCGSDKPADKTVQQVDTTGSVDKVFEKLEEKKDQILETAENVAHKVQSKVQSAVAGAEIPEKFQSILNQYDFSAKDLEQVKADIAKGDLQDLEQHISENFKDASKKIVEKASALLKTDVVVKTKEQAEEILKTFAEHGNADNKTTGSEVVAALAYCLNHQEEFSQEFINEVSAKAKSFTGRFGHGDGMAFLCNKTTLAPEQLEQHYDTLVQEGTKFFGKDIMNKVAVKQLNHEKAVQYSKTIQKVADDLFNEKNGRFFKYIQEMTQQLPAVAKEAVADAAAEIQETVQEVKEQVKA
jgi:hypothetical protein